MTGSDMATLTRLASLAGREPTEALSGCYLGLDSSYPDDYRGAATLLASEWSSAPPHFLGLGGGQGAGKSTLSRLIELACASFGIRVCTLSLDDFYFSRARRKALAEEIHPLLETRGPPGTHDIERCHEAMGRLRQPGDVELPIFDKGSDEARGVRKVTGPFDLVLLEGWCVGASPVADEALVDPINELERTRDPEMVWRRYVNTELGGSYARTWAALDDVVYLRVPDLNAVRRWRLQQESARSESKRLDSNAVDQFVQYFERITLSMLATQSQRASITIGLGEDHSIVSLAFPSE